LSNLRDVSSFLSPEIRQMRQAAVSTKLNTDMIDVNEIALQLSSWYVYVHGILKPMNMVISLVMVSVRELQNFIPIVKSVIT
jgi:hypothetical protein